MQHLCLAAITLLTLAYSFPNLSIKYFNVESLPFLDESSIEFLLKYTDQRKCK